MISTDQGHDLLTIAASSARRAPLPDGIGPIGDTNIPGRPPISPLSGASPARSRMSALEVPLRDGGIDLPAKVTPGPRSEVLTDTVEAEQRISLTAKVVEKPGGTAYIHADAGREEAMLAEDPRHTLPAVGNAVSFGVRGSDCFLLSVQGGHL